MPAHDRKARENKSQAYADGKALGYEQKRMSGITEHVILRKGGNEAFAYLAYSRKCSRTEHTHLIYDIPRCNKTDDEYDLIAYFTARFISHNGF